MAGRPTWPPPPRGSGAEPIADEDSGQAGLRERYGVLAIARDVKEDGRALILYTRAGRETT